MANRLNNIIGNYMLKRLTTALFLLSTSLSLSAQKIDSTASVVTVEDKPLSITTPSKKMEPQTYWHPNPNRAMWYSVLCPGLGQIYNRSYWKVPVIYGGGAVLGYLVSWQGRMYNDYSNAYYDFMDSDPNTVSYERLFRNLNGTDEWKKNTLRKKRDSYRRYRDLCLFGVGILYVVNIIDAFVDGHLYDFSVTNDLSLHVEPFVEQPGFNNFGNDNVRYGLQCSFTF